MQTRYLGTALVFLSMTASASEWIHGCRISPKATCPHAELSRAEMNGADLRGALLCGTIMPDGTLNNSGCPSHASADEL